MLEAGGLDRWRQANYAINVSHYYQRPELDYPMLTPGALVHIAFGPVGMITGNTPEYGFYFTMMTDPPGCKECPTGLIVTPIVGCCVEFEINSGLSFPQGCTTPEECDQYTIPPFSVGLWQGAGADCDPPFGPCPGPEDFEEVCCVLDMGTEFESKFCIQRQFCELYIGGGTTVDIITDPEYPCPVEPCVSASVLEERPGRPRSDGGFLSVTTNYKVGTCPN